MAVDDFHVDVLQPQAVEEDERLIGVAQPGPAESPAASRLEFAQAGAWPHRLLELAHGRRGRVGDRPRLAAWLVVHHPGLASIPAVVLPRAVAVPHDVRAGLDHEV